MPTNQTIRIQFQGFRRKRRTADALWIDPPTTPQASPLQTIRLIYEPSGQFDAYFQPYAVALVNGEWDPRVSQTFRVNAQDPNALRPAYTPNDLTILAQHAIQQEQLAGWTPDTLTRLIHALQFGSLAQLLIDCLWERQNPPYDTLSDSTTQRLITWAGAEAAEALITWGIRLWMQSDRADFVQHCLQVPLTGSTPRTAASLDPARVDLPFARLLYAILHPLAQTANRAAKKAAQNAGQSVRLLSTWDWFKQNPWEITRLIDDDRATWDLANAFAATLGFRPDQNSAQRDLQVEGLVRHLVTTAHRNGHTYLPYWKLKQDGIAQLTHPDDTSSMLPSWYYPSSSAAESAIQRAITRLTDKTITPWHHRLSWINTKALQRFDRSQTPRIDAGGYPRRGIEKGVAMACIRLAENDLKNTLLTGVFGSTSKYPNANQRPAWIDDTVPPWLLRITPSVIQRVNTLRLGSDTNEAEQETFSALTRLCTDHRLHILHGAAGTGKSTVLARAITDILQPCYPDLRVLILAPTGTAADSLYRRFASSGLTDSIRRSTIHRWIGYVDWNPRLKHRPIQEAQTFIPDVIIVDECSMIDTPLFTALFRWIDGLNDRPLVWLAGDYRQLPPVGPGAPWHPMATHPRFAPIRTELILNKRVHELALNAHEHQIAQGQAWNPATLPPNIALQVQSKADALERHIELWVRKHIAQQPNATSDEIPNWLVLTPDNVWSEKLNQKIQQIRNGSNLANDPDHPWSLYDRVINVANDYRQHTWLPDTVNSTAPIPLRLSAKLRKQHYATVLRANDEPIFNGMRGTIVALETPSGKDHASVVVRYDRYPNAVVVYPWDQARSQLQLAYALTIHKAQGQEAFAVALCFPQASLQWLSREALYTAVTRTQHHVAYFLSNLPQLLETVIPRSAYAQIHEVFWADISR